MVEIHILFKFSNCASLTLVVNFGAVLSTEALVLQGFIVHVKLLHHVVVELVPTSAGTTTKRQRMGKHPIRYKNGIYNKTCAHCSDSV